MNNQDTNIPPNAIHCVSGLVYKIVKEGQGDERPGPEDIVQVKIKKITGKGDNVAATLQRLQVNKVNAGLSEAFQLMARGEKLMVWIPAYLEQNIPSTKNKEYVVYEIELEEFQRVKEPPVIPTHLISPKKE